MCREARRGCKPGLLSQTANSGYNGNNHPNAIKMKRLIDDIKVEWFTWTKPVLYSPGQCLSTVRLYLSSVLPRQKEDRKLQRKRLKFLGVGLFWSERWFSSKNGCSCWVPSTHIRRLTAASNSSPRWRCTQRIMLFSRLPAQQPFCSHKTRTNCDFKFYYLRDIFHMEDLDSNSSDRAGQ